MIYNNNWFYILTLFIIFLWISIFFKKYKVISIILPKKWNYWLLSITQKILLFLMFLIICIIPFNIWIYQWTKIEKISTLNIEVLFDVSLSMTAKDLKPNRFDVAKNALINFIKNLDTNYNIWLITFSWKPLVYSPMTDDKKALIWKIQNMSMADFPPTMDFVWTAIWDAILLGSKQLVTFSQKNKKPWVIILLTDGDSNKWVKPLTAVKDIKKLKIPIYVWAIWKDDRYIVWEDIYGSDVPTSIDLKTLKEIAKQTWGEFKKLESKWDFLEILWKLYNYVKNYEQIKKISEYTYFNYYLKWILLVLLTIYWLIFIKFKLK